MILPISETLPALSIEERLERARPKQAIVSSAVGGGLSSDNRTVLYWDDTQGVWLPMMKGKEIRGLG